MELALPADPVRYPDWKAPRSDADVLLWPAPGRLLEDARRNHAHLGSCSRVLIQNVPLAELRSKARTALGHPDERLLIATGHQTELYHPGVWAKDAMIDAAARACDGAAMHFAVDTDAPKHLLVRWPGKSMPVSDDPNLTEADWSGRLCPPSRGHLQRLKSAVRQASEQWGFESLLSGFLEKLERRGAENGSLSGAITAAMEDLDRELGLDHQSRLVSPILESEPYLAFAHHLLSRAGEFAGVYNRALAEYRSAHRVRAAGRPMPDLKTSGSAIETPFWFDAIDTAVRRRLTVHGSPDGFRLDAPDGSGRFVFDAGADGWTAAARLGRWLRQGRLRLSPRALTLTMFFRLLLVDQFAHGIGGGRYDQVTDAMIAAHWSIAPPAFCVTTATLFFPDAAGRARVCLPCIEQEGHRLRHSLLGESKRRMVRRIEQLPRHSAERRRVFFEMHRARRAAAADSPRLAEWQRQRDEAAARDAEDARLFDRELLYPIQPRDRLEGIIEEYHRRFAG